MHGLLAVSALHYADFHPAERAEYHVISTHYSTLALEKFRALINDLSEDNCETYFLFASLIYTLSLCNVARPAAVLTTHDVSQSFQLLKGLRLIIDYKPLEQWLTNAPLGNMLRCASESLSPAPTALSPAPRASSLEPANPFHARLDKLQHLARQLPRSLELINPQSATFLSLECLRNTHLDCRRVADIHAAPHIWSWPIIIPSVFLDMIDSGHPIAIIILAHFAALSWPYEHKEWASHGWSKSIMGLAERTLDEEWSEWIVWPKRSLEERVPVDAMEE
ncbi:uncharacterized protein E0L32_000893 [Thyridium curvatum]|uniref:Uncharacterized protein n=1 Tax=Thyridium curvatum TaxID=1093900 RepID=A0A507B106_9PEZI|nr:uncharacterized protein E0L32_000893 [Thyridium curvatum]TPX12716.1 hypothetical protein E0L32_000893 [Thyridium curvatum]